METENTKKYELTEEVIVVDGHKLHRIRALKDFANVKAGEFGGFIESEDNLSHEGRCWVYYDAKVYGKARVYDNALVHGKAQVYDSAQVYGNARVCDNAQVYGDARVFDNACVRDQAQVYDKAMVYGRVWLAINAVLNGTSTIGYYIDSFDL